MEICLAESFGKRLLEVRKTKFKLSGGSARSWSCSLLSKRLP